MRNKKILKRIGVGVAVLAVALGIVAWITLTWVLIRPPSYSPKELHPVKLRSWSEHNRIYQAAEFPYVLSLEHSQGALEYIGALHTSDAGHPQLAEIEARWAKFKPTVVFCEGRQRMSRFSTRVTNGNLSESQLVRILAYQNGVPLYSLEPTYDDEVRGLLTKFDPKLVATYMTIRTYTSESSGMSARQQNDLALGLLRKRTNVSGLENTLSTIEELDRYWKTQFPDAPDWRLLKNTEQVPLLNTIGNKSREIRGQHMISSIAEIVEKGERVFAVVGASHVIRQELELKRLIQ